MGRRVSQIHPYHYWIGLLELSSYLGACTYYFILTLMN